MFYTRIHLQLCFKTQRNNTVVVFIKRYFTEITIDDTTLEVYYKIVFHSTDNILQIDYNKEIGKLKKISSPINTDNQLGLSNECSIDFY